MIISVLKNEINNLRQSDFGRNFLTLLSGTTISQIIPFVVAPILTRLFTPEEFGFLALFTSTSMFMGNIATMQYDSAIMLPEKDEDALNILALSLLSVIIITILTLFIVLFFNDTLCKIMGNSEIGIWLYFIPISVFLTGIFRTLNIWSSRMKQFKRLATRNIMQSSTTAGTKLGLGYLTKINGGLIIGSLVGQLTATIALAIQTIYMDKININIITKKSIIKNAKRYKDYPIFFNLNRFISMFKETGIRYIISNFFGATVLGSYSFTFGILQKPTQIIGNSISQVYFQKAVSIFNAKEDLWGFTKRIIFRLGIISAILYLPILLFGQAIFKFLFGENWEVAGLYAQIMTPWLISNFIIQIMFRIPQIVNKQKAYFKISAFFNICFFSIVLVFSVLKFEFQTILVVMTLLSFCMMNFLLFWFRRITIRP